MESESSLSLSYGAPFAIIVALYARPAVDPDPAPEARQKLAQSVRTGSPMHKSSERRRRDTSFFIGKQMQGAIAF